MPLLHRLELGFGFDQLSSGFEDFLIALVEIKALGEGLRDMEGRIHVTLEPVAFAILEVQRPGVPVADLQNPFDLGANPFGVQIRAEEVADAVAFLASDGAGAYTGGNLILDRGSMLGRFPNLPPDRPD